MNNMATYSNSPLVSITDLSPNYTAARNHVIDTITPHCFVGQVTAKRGLEVFKPNTRGASCNYVVGYDGNIGLCVEESHRSWCSGGTDSKGNPIRVNGISGSSNDYQAVTLEIACDSFHPYAITNPAMDATIKLMADIAVRNKMGILKWKADKNLVGKTSEQNITVHRWFANKACPGDYIYNRLGEIVAECNKIITGSGIVVPDVPSAVPYKVKILADALNIRTGPGTGYGIRDCIRDHGTYTIVSEATGEGAALWGKLKSGAGWIALGGTFTKKV